MTINNNVTVEYHTNKGVFKANLINNHDAWFTLVINTFNQNFKGKGINSISKAVLKNHGEVFHTYEFSDG